PETDPSWLIPQIPLPDIVADIGFEALFHTAVRRLLRFELHRMGNAAEITQCNPARARTHSTLQRVVGHERIDERAIERFGGAAQGFKLDRSAFFRRFKGCNA